MTKFIVNNRTDAWKTEVNLFFTTTNCQIVRSRTLTERARTSAVIVKFIYTRSKPAQKFAGGYAASEIPSLTPHQIRLSSHTRLRRQKQKHSRAKSLQLRRPREFDLPGWLLKIETSHIYSRFLGITNTINGSVRFHLCFAIYSLWWSLSWKTSRNKLLVPSVWIFTPNPRP